MPLNLKHLLVSISIILWSLTSVSQPNVYGIIRDSQNQGPIEGVLIFTPSDTTISDLTGHFELPIHPDSILILAHPGYKSMMIKGIVENPLEIWLDPNIMNLNEVVITSGFSPSLLKNSLGSLSLTTQDMTERDAPFSYVNSMNRIPGVYMHSGTLSTSRITIRGIGSRSLFGTNKVKAYLEQIPLNDGSGNLTIEDIDPTIIGRIEVLKGPNSSRFGAGLAGVIQLYGPTIDRRRTTLESGLDIGAFGTSKWHASASTGLPNGALKLGYTSLNSDGYRANSHYQRKQASAFGNWEVNPKHQITYLGLYADVQAFIPSAIGETDYQNNPQKAAFTWGQSRGYEDYQKLQLGATWKYLINDQLNLNHSYFIKTRTGYEPRPFNILTENTFSFGSRSNINYQSQKLTLTLGYEWFKDMYDWETFENNYTATSNGSVQGQRLSDFTENRFYYNLYAEASLAITSQLKWTGGLNFNHTRYQLNDQFVTTTDLSGSYSYSPFLSPRTGLLWSLSDQWSLYTTISQGFSPPGLDETLYPDGQINPNIRPEKGWNYELGSRGSIGKWSLDFSAYYMDISDLIVTERINADQYVGVNAGKNIHKGIDLSLNYFINLSTNHTLNFFNSLAFMDYKFDQFINDGQDYSGNQLTGVPQLTMTPGIELISQTGFYGNINGQYTGEIPINDANELYAQSYFLIRSKMGYRKTWGNLKLDLYVGGENLTDQKYASMLLINATAFGTAEPRIYYPGNPRNLFGGLKISYSFMENAL